MKTLKHLEKSRLFWYLLVILLTFFLLRLPSLIEPYWYGDEGIYQVLGIAINEGRQLYTEAWDNKPPLLYVLYSLFSSDQFALRLVSLIAGMLTTLVFFFLSQRILKSVKASIVVTLLFTFLFATPYLEGNIANAENFILLLTISAGFLIYTKIATVRQRTHGRLLSFITTHRLIPAAGFLVGIAFLFKTVALFDFIAFSLFILLIHAEKLNNVKTIFKEHYQILIAFAGGFLLPVIVTFFFFLFQGSAIAFIQSAFFGNVDYVEYQNTLFGIPQGLLILKLVLLMTVVVILARKRKDFSKPELFISIWFCFSLFSSLFSGRPYTHYLLILLPSFCLVIGLLITTANTKIKMLSAAVTLAVCAFILNTFTTYGIGKTFKYYDNVLSFLSGSKSVRDYQSFFDPETPRDYEIAGYIKSHTNSSDQVFIWGDSAQIYALAGKLPPGRYTTAYHIMEQADAVSETQDAIDKTKPKFIITLSEAPPLPFHLPSYIGIYGIKGAAIYERTF